MKRFNILILAGLVAATGCWNASDHAQNTDTAIGANVLRLVLVSHEEKGKNTLDVWTHLPDTTSGFCFSHAKITVDGHLAPVNHNTGGEVYSSETSLPDSVTILAADGRDSAWFCVPVEQTKLSIPEVLDRPRMNRLVEEIRGRLTPQISARLSFSFVSDSDHMSGDYGELVITSKGSHVPFSFNVHTGWPRSPFHLSPGTYDVTLTIDPQTGSIQPLKQSALSTSAPLYEYVQLIETSQRVRISE